jgi:hypothetical protein
MQDIYELKERLLNTLKRGIKCDLIELGWSVIAKSLIDGQS